MYLVYLGESGDTGTSLSDPNQPHHVLVGLLVHDTLWEGINAEFDVVCQGHFLNSPGEQDAPREIRLAEVFQGRGAFISWPKAKRHQLIDDLVSILTKRQTPLIVAYMHKGEFAAAQPDELGRKAGWGAPWVPAFSRLLFSLDILMDESNMETMSSEQLHRGDTPELKERATIIANAAKRSDSRAMQELIRTEVDLPTGAILEGIHFASPEDSHCTQLADMCAYFMRRRFQQPDLPSPQYDALEDAHVLQVIYPVQL